MGFNKLSDANIKLRKEKSALGAQLGVRTAEKVGVEKELEKLKSESNATEFTLKQKVVSAPMFQLPGSRNRLNRGNNQILHLQENCEKKVVLLMLPRRAPAITAPALMPANSTNAPPSL